MVLCPLPIKAESRAIAVLYPEVEEPFNKVFTDIVDGITQQAKVTVEPYQLADKQDMQPISDWLEQRNIKVIVALGRKGLMVARELEGNRPVLVGALIVTPEDMEANMSGISLVPDPARLFTQLHKVAPAVKRVHVVYDPVQNKWLVELAREAAAAQGLKLLAYDASSLRAATHHYRDIFKGSVRGEDALWLPQDTTTVDEKVILPLVLRESWDKYVAIISANPSHTRRGTLLALFPNNQALGMSLGRMAMETVALGKAGKGVVPLQDLDGAINTRTASHLGINLSTGQQSDFVLQFPLP